ncbi:MAG: type III polyketide synthase [Rhodospirillaceae bacterium]|nr:type III polyketide synthase [Rhodospirillales bacterium]
MPPRLAAIATAAPSHTISRTQVAAMARQVFGDELDRLGPIYANAGIDQRQSCVPLEWYLRPHGWKERSDLFVQHALDLAARAVVDCVAKAGLRLDQVDALVAVSTTGMCTPSLDALLMERLGLRRDVTRLPIFGLGCAGGVLGLARAAALAKAMPGSNVVMVVVELCGLTFRPGDRSASNMVATALFGDGCAAALLSTTADGPALTAWGEHTWPDSLDIMGWHVEDDGFGVQFSRDIPPLVARHFRPALDGWLAANGLEHGQIDRFLCHPGGAKVVNALEEALTLPPGTLALERDVLRDYGNMSAATLMFVLERALAGPLPRRSVAAALGPGFTVGFLLLETL